jgi:hypothetical protein
MTPLEKVLTKFPDATKSGKGWAARCPAHEGRRPTLSVAQGEKGGAVLHCHAGCEQATVVAATCRFTTGSRSAVIAPIAAGSLISLFGTEIILYFMNSMQQDRSMSKKRTNLLTDQLREAIDDSGLTRYRIAKETGISESALAQFYNGHRGLSMEALNALGEFLQLKIILGRKPGKKGN